MSKEEIIKEIADIQYYIKTNVYNENIPDKLKYIEKVNSIYRNMDINEVKENLEEIKYLAVNAIKIDIRKKIEDNCIYEKNKAYKEYINKCNAIELEMKENIIKNKELKHLTVDSLISYINNKNIFI